MNDTTPVSGNLASSTISRDLLWAIGGGILLLLLVALSENVADWPWLRGALQLIRLPLGLVYVLYVPGYCLTAALFPGTDDLDGIERTGLSLGLSVAWVPVLALILDRLPWGLRLWPILWGEILSLLLFSAVALWRRSRLPVDEAYAPEMVLRPRSWWYSLSLYEQRIYKLCAGALLVAGLAAAWVFLVPSPAEFFTEFYVLGAEGLAEDYPRETVPEETLSVTLGITNRERQDHTYRVEVWVIDIWSDRRELVTTVGPLTLARGDTVEQPVSWVMPWVGDDQQVELYLYIDDQEAGDTPYRRLRLWMNVLESD